MIEINTEYWTTGHVHKYGPYKVEENVQIQIKQVYTT